MLKSYVLQFKNYYFALMHASEYKEKNPEFIKIWKHDTDPVPTSTTFKSRQ